MPERARKRKFCCIGGRSRASLRRRETLLETAAHTPCKGATRGKGAGSLSDGTRFIKKETQSHKVRCGGKMSKQRCCRCQRRIGRSE